MHIGPFGRIIPVAVVEWDALMQRYAQTNFGRSMDDQGDSDQSRLRITGHCRVATIALE